MTLYELLKDKQYNYLVYIAGELRKIENLIIISKFDRDSKLKLLLYPDLCEGYNSLLDGFNKIVDTINNLDVYNLSIEELEKIGDLTDQLFKYFEYIEEQIKLKK
jgi:hypothetical protein